MSIESIAAAGTVPVSQPVSQTETTVAAQSAVKAEPMALEPVSKVDEQRRVREVDGAGVLPSQEQVEGIVKQLNEMMQSASRDISFSVDRDYEELVILVKDSTTDEVIRQIPNEDALKLAEHVSGMLGLIFNEQV